MPRKSRKNLLQGQPIVAETPKATTFATWGYTRISVDGERSEDSIESQTAIIKDYVTDESRPYLELQGVISDLGFSGTNFDRPGYAELLAGIMQGTVQCVVVKDLSRLGRTYIEVGELLFDTFPTYNVRFISVNDNYDSFADDAARKKLLILFKNLVNHMYSKDFGKKVRSGHAMRIQRGGLMGLPPYGYVRNKEGTSFVIDQEAADIVKLIFEMRLAGNSNTIIAIHLNRQGVPTIRNRFYQLGLMVNENCAKKMLWTNTTVNRLLKCEMYTGVLVQGKYYYEGKKKTLLPEEQWIKHVDAHPAIVSREDFEEAQKSLESTSTKHQRTGRNNIPPNRYTGRMYCAKCGYATVRNAHGDGGKYSYYFCNTCNRKIREELGLRRIPNLTEPEFDAIIMGSLRTQIKMLVDCGELVSELVKSESYAKKLAAIKQECAKCEKIIATTDKTIATAYEYHLKDGGLDFREFELIKTGAWHDKQAAEDKLAQYNSELKRYADISDRHVYWCKIYEELCNSETPTKELIHTLIKRIEITPFTNEIHIIFNFVENLEEYQRMLSECGVSEDA